MSSCFYFHSWRQQVFAHPRLYMPSCNKERAYQNVVVWKFSLILCFYSCIVWECTDVAWDSWIFSRMTDIPDILFRINLLKPRFWIWNSQKKKKQGNCCGEIVSNKGRVVKMESWQLDLNHSGLPLLPSWSCEFNELWSCTLTRTSPIVVNMHPIDWAEQCPQSNFSKSKYAM